MTVIHSLSVALLALSLTIIHSASPKSPGGSSGETCEDTKDLWSASKKAWCCKHKQIGCAASGQAPSAAPPQPPICPAGCTSFFDGCNTCSCNTDGSLGACTKKACEKPMPSYCASGAGGQSPSAAPPQPPICPAGCTSFFDGCNTCSCNADGSLDICTKQICANMLPTFCASGDGSATGGQSPSAAPPQLPICPAGCTSFFDGCNICSCNTDGSLGACTKKACGKTMPSYCASGDGSATGGQSPSAAPPQPPICPAGCTSFFDGCNTCSCNADGSLGACTKKACGKTMPSYCASGDGSATGGQSPSAAPPQPPICPAGCTSFFDGCNTCSCNTDGSLGACTKKACEKPMPSYCASGTTGGQSPSAAPPQLPICPAGCTSFFDGCNICSCNTDGSLGACTEKACANLLPPFCASGGKDKCDQWAGPASKGCPQAKCKAPQPGCRHVTRYTNANDKCCPILCNVECDGSSTADESGGGENCYTREVWSADKKAWCCKHKQLGCSSTSAAPSAVPATKMRKIYVVKHTIVLRNMAPDVFNTNKNVQKAFEETVAKLLDIDAAKIRNIRACLVGQTEAECPGDVSADTSANPETSTRTGGGENGGRRFLPSTTDSEIRYEIVSQSEREMNVVATSVKGERYQKQGSFTTEFSASMKAHQVSAEVADQVSAKPNNDATTEIEQVPDESVGPNDGSSSDESTNSDGDETNDNNNNGMLGAVAGTIGVAVLVGLVYFTVKKKRKRRRDSRRMVDDLDQEVEMGVWNPSVSVSNNKPVFATVVGTSSMPTAQTIAAPLDGGGSVWQQHVSPEGTYYYDETSGRTTWTKPAKLKRGPALLKK